jgi:hypothetical protein
VREGGAGGGTGVEDVFGPDDSDGDFAQTTVMLPLGLELPKLLKRDLPLHRQLEECHDIVLRHINGDASHHSVAIGVGDADELVDLSLGVKELLQKGLFGNVSDNARRHNFEGTRSDHEFISAASPIATFIDRFKDFLEISPILLMRTLPQTQNLG